MDGYKLFRRDRRGRSGGGVALYVREGLDCTELHDCDDKVECLWVRMRGKADKADIVLGVCYRPPDQVEEMDEVFYKRLAGVLELCALVLVGDFNFPDVCWKYATAESKQSRRFLECVEDNFPTQPVGEPTRGRALLDLLFTNREGLVGSVMVRGRLGLSDREMIEFSILGEARKGVSKATAMDFRRANFGLFEAPVERVPWETVLKGKRGPGGMDVLQEGNLNGSGPGYSPVPQVKPPRKTTGLAERGAFARNQEKKESLSSLEERAGNLGGVQGSC
ncbi:uncharacterized protein ACIBXB_004039 [Morphnus guianensis]